MICNICLDDLKMKERKCMKTICHHSFHWVCLLKWLRIRPECPCCRSPLSIFDCSPLEQDCITHPKGILINQYKYYPQSLYDFKLCILYTFFKEYGVYFDFIPTHLDKTLLDIIQNIIEYYHNSPNSTPFTITLDHFYKSYPLTLHFQFPPFSNNMKYTHIDIQDFKGNLGSP